MGVLSGLGRQETLKGSILQKGKVKKGRVLGAGAETSGRAEVNLSSYLLS